MTENTTASGAADALRAAITRAFNLGQTYWQQADSESYAEQDKSDSTYKKYKALLEETCTTLVASAPVAPAPHPDLRVQVMEIITGVWDHDTQIDDATDDVLDLAAAPKAEVAPAGEYPSLPAKQALYVFRGKDGGREEVHGYDELQMWGFVDADRAMRAQAAPAAAAGPSETVKFVDESTADPVEKARRYLKAMGDQRMNSAYFFDDGYPRREGAQDALAALEVLERLAAAITTQVAPQPAARRDMTDEDMDTLVTLLGQHERDEIGHQGLVEAIVREFGRTAAPQPAVPALEDADVLSMSKALFLQREADAKDAARWRYAVAIGGNQVMNWLDVYDDWDGDGDFADAIDAARAQDGEGGA